MNSRDPAGDPFIGRVPRTGKTQWLVEYLASGCKPPDKFRLGAEQEQFVYLAKDFRPATYDSPEPGIRSLVEVGSQPSGNFGR